MTPRLTIIVRTKRLEDASELERAGASQVISEELEAAAEIIICLLEVFGLPRKEAFAHIQETRTQPEPSRVE